MRVDVGRGCHCSGTGWESVGWGWAIGVFCIICFFSFFFFSLCCFPLLLFLVVNCLYLNTWVFTLLCFLFFPHQLRGVWASSCVVLSCLLRLNYDRFPNLIPGCLVNFSVFLPAYLSLFLPSVGFLFVLEFIQDLLVHPCRPPDVFAWVSFCWDAWLLSLEEVILEY